MRNKRDCAISIRNRTVLNQKVSLMHVCKLHIGLAKRVRLNGLIGKLMLR
jgi:hypothetical protein